MNKGPETNGEGFKIANLFPFRDMAEVRQERAKRRIYGYPDRVGEVSRAEVERLTGEIVKKTWAAVIKSVGLLVGAGTLATAFALRAPVVSEEAPKNDVIASDASVDDIDTTFGGSLSQLGYPSRHKDLFYSVRDEQARGVRPVQILELQSFLFWGGSLSDLQEVAKGSGAEAAVAYERLAKFYKEHGTVVYSKSADRMEKWEPERGEGLFAITDYKALANKSASYKWLYEHAVSTYEPEGKTLYLPLLTNPEDVRELANGRLVFLMLTALNDAYMDIEGEGVDYSTIVPAAKESGNFDDERVLGKMGANMSVLAIATCLFHAARDAGGSRIEVERNAYLLARRVLASKSPKLAAVEKQLKEIVENPWVLEMEIKIGEAEKFFRKAGWQENEAKRIGQWAGVEMNRQHVMDLMIWEIALEFVAAKNPNNYADLIEFFRNRVKAFFIDNTGGKMTYSDGQINGSNSKIVGFEGELHSSMPSVQWLNERNLPAYDWNAEKIYYRIEEEPSHFQTTAMLVALEDAMKGANSADVEEKSNLVRPESGELMGLLGGLEVDFSVVAKAFVEKVKEDDKSKKKGNFSAEELVAEMVALIKNPELPLHLIIIKELSRPESEPREALIYFTLRILYQCDEAEMRPYRPAIREMIEEPRKITEIVGKLTNGKN